MSDDEYRINLGKLGSLFKRSKKEQIKEEKEKIKELKEEEKEVKQEIKEEQKKLQEIKKEKQEDKPETVSFDFNKLKKFLIKYQIPLLLILIIALQFVPNQGYLPWGGAWMRMQNQDIPQADVWAEQAVHAFFKQRVKETVDKEYPNLPDKEKKEIVNERFQEVLKEGKDIVDQQISQNKIQLRDHYQYEHQGEKYTYMPDIDPYYYLRGARNILEKGHAYDELRDGVPWNTHMLAPQGKPFGFSGHYYVLAGIYKIMHLFNSKIDLMQAAAYFGIIFVILALIPAFFIGRKFAGNVGGIFTASMVSLCGAGFGRTPWGHADTDAYQIFFPLLIMWLFIEMFSAKDFKKKIFFAGLTGLSVGFYSMAWQGWWYVFDFLIATLGVYFVYLIITNRKNLRKSAKSIKEFFILAMAFFLTSGIFVTLFMGFSKFVDAPTQPIKFIFIKSAAKATLWPNVLTTVAELNQASLKTIINSVGGSFLFLIAVIGVILMLLKKDEFGKHDFKYSILLTIWFIGTIYASTKGVRFTLLLAPAFSVAFGVSVGLLHNKISTWLEKEININKYLASTVLIVLFAILLITPAKADYKQSQSDLPIINDAWWNALTKIKEKSEPNAIVNSWWDFGHHFKYISDRAVTFDGASQAKPRAHWIGRVLLTDNEKEAIGILRMLDCGGNNAFDTLNKTESIHKSISLLYEILVLSKKEAKEVLTKAKIKQVDEVLKYTHCTPPENYFITSDDMIHKAGVWAHFGGWNFERAEIWQNLRKLPKDKFIQELKNRFDYGDEKSEDIYFKIQSLSNEQEANNWISPWPGYQSSPAGCKKDNNEIICNNGVVVNLEKNSAKINLQQGEGIPQSIVYIDENKNFSEIKINGSNVPLSVVLVPTKNGGYRSYACDPKIAKSMFNRLFFLGGHGLEYFELFDEQTQITGGKIYVWKINWEGGEERVHRALIEKEVVSKGDTVAADYIGWLENGTVFDSSISDWKEKNISKDSEFMNYESNPLSFLVGSGQMIKGFDDAVIGMKKGEEKEIKIGPEDAYGTDPENHPLGNKTLNFKIKVEMIK